MDAANPAALSAAHAARAIREGALTSEEMVRACLERIRETEPKVQAWTFLDEDHALAQACAADDLRRSGEPVGPLCGIPVGIKDIIDTADMPTENGTPLHRGRTPRTDAAVVARLRAATLRTMWYLALPLAAVSVTTLWSGLLSRWVAALSSWASPRASNRPMVPVTAKSMASKNDVFPKPFGP